MGKVLSGWVFGIQSCSIWGRRTGPAQVLSILGDDSAEIIAITGLMQEGKYDYVYAARNILTGQFVTNKKKRSKGEFYSKRWDDAGTWTRPQHVKVMIRSWVTFCKRECMLKYNLTIRAEEMEIIKMPIFIPPREIT